MNKMLKIFQVTPCCHLANRARQHDALAFGLKILAVSVSGDDIQIHSKKLSWTVFIKIYQFLHIFIIYHHKNSQSKLLRINWNIISRHTHCQYFQSERESAVLTAPCCQVARVRNRIMAIFQGGLPKKRCYQILHDEIL